MLVTEADVDHVKNDLIMGLNAFHEDRFDNLIDSGDTSIDAIPYKDTFNLLKQIALKSQLTPCNINSLSYQSSQNIEKILEDLDRRGVITITRDNCCDINVGLFKEWLIVNQ
jgi:hypothetical protein